MRHLKYLLPGAMALIGTAAAAEAPVDISANTGIVSDYRFRGISLSDRGPAVQGGVDLTTKAGFFAGTWASTIADNEGAEVELYLYAGYAAEVAGFDLTFTANTYLYPGANGVNYAELSAIAERTLGPFTLGLEAALTPRQDNVDEANHYLGASAAFEIPGTGIVAKARGGYEDGFYDRKWDWEVGASYSRSIFTASLSYVGTNRGAAHQEGRAARDGIVASLLAEF
ncbi:TorF family putative porin [Sphingosinicella rhizophila]|uniref:TorF family putative porin n=1 Tax=Sphingosinicella rhizophila TaxID=3050082 RepID=A0ABU3Q9W8_9SPHN|nr:TorF family putative porin [Sphingosinicella sp. GR2756]MDT9600187.1 TorF family putative porin [Sphingosinicella sp. GR2756]